MEFSNRRLVDRMDELRSHFDQGIENKAAVPEVGVRHCQRGGGHDFVVVQEQIQIESSRAPVSRADATQLSFNRLQDHE